MSPVRRTAPPPRVTRAPEGAGARVTRGRGVSGQESAGRGPSTVRRAQEAPHPHGVPRRKVRERPTLTEFPAARSVSGCVPVRAEADLHLEGHGEIRSMPHPVRDDRGEFVEFALGDLEDQFVVNLQQ